MTGPMSVRGEQEKKSRAKIRSCFIAAPSRTDLETIKSLLRDKGFRPVVVSELIHTGAPIVEHVMSAISKADLIMAVLDKEQSNENVYFELGMASALGKRLLVLAPPLIKLPADIDAMLTLRTDPENREAIDFALDQALVGVETRPPRQRPMWTTERTRPIGDLARELMNRLESLGDRVTESDVQEIVSSALKASGVSVVVQAGIRDTRLDMAVWSDGLHPWVGNPLLIEIKKRLGNWDQLRSTVSQLTNYLEEINAHWALVLYVEESPVFVEMSVSELGGSTVLFMTVQELLERLRTTSFVDIIIGLRNQRLHGAS